MSDAIDISIVMPCLNEELTLPRAIELAQAAVAKSGLNGEVMVADNGSTDRSREIATQLGARVVPVERKGYGSAVRAGCVAARGRFLIMGDADGTYDFREAISFVDDLKAGSDLVMGTRLAGTIHKGAMPFLHRYLGTPVLSFLINLFFGLKITDCNCGLRAFTRAAFDRLALVSVGMEFASEMIIKAGLYRMKVTEKPCSLHPDRRDRVPHLRTWRDGWRHLRFILLFAPHVIFQIPGWLALIVGGLVTAFVLPGPNFIGSRIFDYHYLFYSIPLVFLGYQAIWFDKIESYYVRFAGYLPDDLRGEEKPFRLEVWLLIGLALALAGGGILVSVLVKWVSTNYGTLREIRPSAAGMVLLILGMQTMMNAMVISMMDMKVDRRV